MIDIFSLTSGLPQSLKKTLSGADKLLTRHKRMLNQNIWEVRNSKKQLAGVPANATIREEHVKCKKFQCMMCPHGPYYYAYWKENGKLKKKYIGTKYDKTWRKQIKTGSKC